MLLNSIQKLNITAYNESRQKSLHIDWFMYYVMFSAAWHHVQEADIFKDNFEKSSLAYILVFPTTSKLPKSHPCSQETIHCWVLPSYGAPCGALQSCPIYGLSCAI